MNKHIKRYITVMIILSVILEGFAVYFNAYDSLRVPYSLCSVGEPFPANVWLPISCLQIADNSNRLKG